MCGSCTVLVDGEAVRSCLMFAVQADGAEVTTVEGMGGAEGGLGPVQEAFRDAHGLQCGFCTPGSWCRVTAFLRDHPDPTDAEIRDALSGNLCRCTGYQGIVEAVRLAAQDVKNGATGVTATVRRSPLRRSARAPARGRPAVGRPRHVRRRRRPARDAARRVRPQRHRARPHRRRSTQRTARAMEGVVAVLTGADLNSEVHARLGRLRPARPVTSRWYRVLAEGDVRFVGEPVAVVLAESRYVAEDACALVDVEIEAEPAVVDVDAALADGRAARPPRARHQPRR